MAFMGSMLGQNGTGMNFRAGSANLQTPTTDVQAQESYKRAADAYTQQQAFLQALQGQNGIANQSSVYNQLQGVADGTGPNPAKAMLDNATGANTANTAALMAGQRGAGANVGLIARQAAQQGAANEQNLAGQGAALQANQSLNAINSMGGLATNQVAQQAGATTGLNQAAQSEQQNILNAIQGQNTSAVQNEAQKNAANAGLQGIIANGQQALTGGILSGAGAAMGLAQGGEVPAMVPVKRMAAGGPVTGPKSAAGRFLYGSAPNQDSASSMPELAAMGGTGTGAQAVNKGSSDFGKGLVKGIGKLVAPSAPTPGMNAMNSVGGAGFGPQGMTAMPGMAKGGKVPAMLSPGEKYLSPEEVEKFKRASNKKEAVSKLGEKIKGKAKVSGDSLKNDIVPKKLDSGGIVIPRSDMKKLDEAVRFVSAICARSHMQSQKKRK